LKTGERINPAMIAVLASFGYATARVFKRPRVAVLATGTELVPVDKMPGQDQIRDSNNWMISAYSELAGADVTRLPLASDNTALLKRQIAEAAEQMDVVVTSGGVSMGVYDLTKVALKELGAEIFFERVALKPGKPTVFGRLPTGALVFGLPGNPVSVAVTFNLFARTALFKMQGGTCATLLERNARLAKSVKGANERESYLPARLHSDEQGHLIAEPLKWGGSSDFVSFSRATALIIVPARTKMIETNEVVKVVELADI
jgi:molybdenum cofactor synthesis domain-containing protein